MSEGVRFQSNNNIAFSEVNSKKTIDTNKIANSEQQKEQEQLSFNLKSTNNTSLLKSGKAEANLPIFNTGMDYSSVTKDTLINAIKSSDLAEKYESSSSSKKTIDSIAELSISVGERENIDPRLLFAIAMQESDCGTNTKHAGSAKGAMGILPAALTSVKRDPTFKKGLENTTHAQLSTNHEKSLIVASRYLKIATRELEAKVKSGISEDSLSIGNLNYDTWKILSSYRWGAGTASKDLKKDGDIDKGYEKTFKKYLESMGINLFK